MAETFIRFRSPAKVVKHLGTWLRPSKNILVRCEVCKDVRVVPEGSVFECCPFPQEK